MKNKILILLFAIIFIAQKQDCFAQQHAKITVTKEGDKSPKTYVFAEFPDAIYYCAKDQGAGQQRTQLTFGKNLENNGSLGVHISIMTSSLGTFTLNPPESKNVMQGDISIQMFTEGSDDLELVAFPDNGTNGSITIIRYPPVGSFIVGTFKARLQDSKTTNGPYYDVSGDFNVKRTQ